MISLSPRASINLLFYINGLVFASWASRLPDLQSKYLFDNHTLGLILLAHSIGAVIAMPGTGWLINRFGSQLMCRISCFVNVLFFLFLPAAIGFWSISFIFFIMGVSAGVLDVSMNAQGVAVESRLNKPIMTFFHAMFSIGMVSGGLLGALAYDQTWTLFMHFSIASLFSLVLFLPAYKHLIDLTENQHPSNEPVLVWPKGPIIALGFIAFCCMMGEGAMSDWSTNYMLHSVQCDPGLATFGLIAFASCMTTGRLFGDRGRLLLGDHKILLWGALASLIGILLIISMIHPFVVILGFGIIGLGLSNIVPIVYSLAGSFPDISPGVGIAMSTTIGYSGFMIGPPLIGFLSDAFSLRWAFLLFLLLFSIMLIIVLSRNKS